MKEFLIHQFDKIILLALVVFFTGVALHIIHDSQDAATVNWSLTLVSGVVGALLTLIIGAIAKASGSPKSNSSKETETHE